MFLWLCKNQNKSTGRRCVKVFGSEKEWTGDIFQFFIKLYIKKRRARRQPVRLKPKASVYNFLRKEKRLIHYMVLLIFHVTFGTVPSCNTWHKHAHVSCSKILILIKPSLTTDSQFQNITSKIQQFTVSPIKLTTLIWDSIYM